jgi:methylenetetrahydrofolate reductase (NADPH)
MLRRKMEAGQFVVTIELTPPRAPDLTSIAARLEKNFLGHADAINVTDCASSILRMSILCACQVILHAGGEPVMQLTCRDRNRIALQSELISAYASGVRNILCLTGDHVRFGDHPTAKPVFDLDAVNLIAMVGAMRREGQYCSGDPIRLNAKSETLKLDWLIGAAANPYGNRPEHLAAHLDKKRRAGADFLQTQPIFDLAGFDAWWRALTALDLEATIKIMPGLLPPKSAHALEYMKEHVSGVRIPDEVIRRMKAAANPEAEGKKITLELVDFLLQYPIAGLHLYPVFWESYMPELAGEIRERAARAGHALGDRSEAAAAS